MKRVLIINLFLYFIVSNLGAQNNYREGYIITHSLDTIYGDLLNSDFLDNSRYCEFKSRDSGNFLKFFPNEIYGYRFKEDKFYISKEIELNNEDTLFFFEYLINGELDFYFRQDKNLQNRYYASTNDSTLIELKYSNEIVNRLGKLYEKEDLQYQHILKVFTRAYPDLISKIENLNVPGHKNLIKFGKHYHGRVCDDYECIVYQKEMKYLFRMEIVAYQRILFSEMNSPHTKFANIINAFGANLYLNNPKFRESSYFGIGYLYEGKVKDSNDQSGVSYRIPVTYGHYSSKPGVRLMYSGGINLRNTDRLLFSSFSLVPGVTYRVKNLIVKSIIDFEFLLPYPLEYPRVYSLNVGVGLNYQIN